MKTQPQSRIAQSSRIQQPSSDNDSEMDNHSVIVISDDSEDEPEPQNTDGKSADSDCESLFGDREYIPRDPFSTSTPPLVLKSPLQSPITLPLSNTGKSSTSTVVTSNGIPDRVQISRKIFFDNGTGKKIVSLKKSKTIFTYELISPRTQQRSSPSVDKHFINGHSHPDTGTRDTHGPGTASVVERTRTPDMILPAIEVLNDLPDYDDEGSDVEGEIDELEPSSRISTPPPPPLAPPFQLEIQTDPANLNENVNINQDVEMAEPEPQLEASVSPSAAPTMMIQKQHNDSVIMDVNTDDESLYVTHDHVIDPSTFVPISHHLQQNSTSLKPTPEDTNIPHTSQTQPSSPPPLPPPPPPPPSSTLTPTSAPRPQTDINPQMEQQTQAPDSTLSSTTPTSPQNLFQHTSPRISPRRATEAIPRGFLNSRSRPRLDISIPKPLPPPPSVRSESPPLNLNFPRFSLRLENDKILPLHIKDDRDSVFNQFLEQRSKTSPTSLSVYGYYLQNDYIKFVKSKSTNVAIGYGRLWLDDNTESHLRQHWTSLRNDLNSKPLCLISLLPTGDEAFIIFSSLNYEFRDSINADKRSMGYRDTGLTIARVRLSPHDLPFARQYRNNPSD
ncbi:hypothetical protein Clacol_005988 [Clathrus columnatus]|uniref:Uncharacterized protein n=1 Tax=Clathrus columnatus TaxID=1419009 RepID=A0AAV5AFS5_9AGAM|nr:hypothetical protein Clacol_005988 [Clathrus columnatus]